MSDTISRQIWRCGTCAKERVWGLSEPADKTARPLLMCAAFCGMRRRFEYVRNDPAEWMNYVQGTGNAPSTKT